jgi:gamma-glutamyltranspeptidase/glutathione hydrolase
MSKEFAAGLAEQIGDRATPSRSLADFPIDLPPESAETTHHSTLDGEGNAVALTYTLEQGYGCKDVIRGGGFLMNNEMGDFNVVPGSTNEFGRIGTAPNTIEPGKRMLSSMSPTLVLKDGKVRVVTGSPGGRTIPNTVLWVVLQLLEFQASPRQAIDAPRTHHSWFPDRLLLEGDGWEEATLNDLKARGYSIGRARLQGDAHSIVVGEDGKIHGAEDRRRRTSKASGD